MSLLSSLTLPAPAKLNLFLHIIGRRADGYHELQTVFQFVDLCDELSFRSTANAEIVLTGDCGGVDTTNNLVHQAARSLQQAARCNQGAEINLKKIIPMGAGLGGGSSDAATTLLALNCLWQTDLSLEALTQLGVNLGADVPVFVRGHAAWAEGIGDRLTNIEPPAPCYLIIQPDCSISTVEIFCHEELTRHTTPIKIAGFLGQPSQCRNDCLAVVQKLYPEVETAMHWLDKFAVARLTGTGACIFAEFASENAATQVLEQLPAHWRGFVARGLNVSPTHSQLPEYKY
ncbi:MAG: 4-(cytidine 5'-diphospho)-2-C-methyl-D-erythritol kinase [Pseudomonadales bacterium]